MELRCVRCAMEPRPTKLAEYLFNGTSLCEEHIRWAIREQQGEAQEGSQ